MITERMLKVLLKRIFLDEEEMKRPANVPPPEDWPEPWRSVFLEAWRRYTADDVSGWDALTLSLGGNAPGYVSDKFSWAQQQVVEIKAAGGSLNIQNYDELAETLPPIRWLWKGWLPRGLLSFMGGFPGVGKSFLALDLARIVSQGSEWPDGSPVETHGAVLYVEGEGVPQITVERIREMGIDGSRMYPLLPDDVGIMNLLDIDWQERVIDMVAELRPELIIVDSFSSVSSNGQNSVEDVNQLLMFFVRLAAFADCGLVVVHHLRKPSSGQLGTGLVTIHDFRGSGHIVAMPRSVLGYSVLPVDGKFSQRGLRHLAIVKTNLGDYPDALGVELVRDEAAGLVRLEYGPAPKGEAATQRDEVGEWLVEYLEEAGEPLRTKDVIEAAVDQGYGRASVYRARDMLSNTIINTKGRKHPRNKWALAAWPKSMIDDD